MEKTRLSSKGQVIIPKNIREQHEWQVGLEFIVIDMEDGVLLKPVPGIKPTTLEDVVGCIPYEGPPKTIQEMDEAIQMAIEESWRDRR